MNLNRSRNLFAIPLLAAVSLVGASLILPTATFASSDVSNPSSPHKVFVCKYVGTPGVNERLKSGKNPISVDLNAINEYKDFHGDIDTLVGGHFADAQGRSFVIAVDRGQPEPPVSDCPGYEPSASPSATPSTSPSESPNATPSSTPSESPNASPSESPSTTPSESPQASPSESATASPSESATASDPDATLTPGQVVVATPAPSGAVQAIGAGSQLTPPPTDTAPLMPAGRDGNPAPVLLLLAALTAVIALATPRARGRARRTR